MAGNLDEASVRHLVRLARLAINDEEIPLVVKQLSAILAYVEQLNELDTAHVPPTAHPLPVSNVFRDDEPHTPWEVGQALANAPEKLDTFFRVPQVLDQKDP